ncbi:MAG TPA: adenylate kinase [Abditibacteriaceae bacterium]|nr:adenylate kinase [Abditibacteriaceae bacterium]
MRLVLLGPPGSGKGTQAVELAGQLGVPHIATGDLFRAEMDAESELGKLAREYIAHGNLVPDEVVNAVMRVRLEQEDCTGFVLDGYPRTVQQAGVLHEMLGQLERQLMMAIHLDMPDEALVERAVGRLVCSQCDAIYHLKSKPPQLMGICDICRGVLVVREDDRPSTVRHRLAVYHRLTQPVLQFYDKQSVLRTVAGLGTPDEVRARICAELDGLCYN